MMKHLLAGAVTVYAAALIASVPAAAEPKQKVQERIMLISPEGGAEPRERVIMLRRGDGLPSFEAEGCDDRTEVTEGSGERQVRILVCGKEGQTAEQRAARLAQVRDIIARSERLSPEQRTRIREALDRAARGQGAQ
jgi:hypothetical protein